MILAALDAEDRPINSLTDMNTISAIMVETTDGERSLEVTTTVDLEKGTRIICKPRDGVIREFVVSEDTAEHLDGGTVWHTYSCPWSLQYDLSLTYVNRIIRSDAPLSATEALTTAVRGNGTAQGSRIWRARNDGDNPSSSGSMYYQTGYEALTTVRTNWGGEIYAEIEEPRAWSFTRTVVRTNHLGSTEPVYRFDYEGSLEGITRTITSDAYAWRIVPRGAGEETDTGGHGRRITIASVNDGKEYLDVSETIPSPAPPTVRTARDGRDFATLMVVNGDIDDPAALKAWALDNMDAWTTPQVTYEATVAQLSGQSMDAYGIALGDVVQVVDRDFPISESATGDLRFETRVVRIEEDLFDPTSRKLTLATVGKTLADAFESISAANNETGTRLNRTIDYINSNFVRYEDGNNAPDLAMVGTYNLQRVRVLTKTGGKTYVLQAAEWGIQLSNQTDQQTFWRWDPPSQVSLELEAAFTTYARSGQDTSLKAEKYGPMVTVSGEIKPTATITGGTSTTAIATLPEGYRPTHMVSAVMQGSSTNIWMLQINTNGVMTFSRYRSGNTYADATTSHWLAINITFRTE